MREKTGYYDRRGKAIRDGDKVRGIIGNDILQGEVFWEENEEQNYASWILQGNLWGALLCEFDDLEILEGE